MARRIFSLILALALVLPALALAEDATASGTPWAYFSEGGAITLKYYSGGRGYLDLYDEDGVTLTIPASIGGVPVAAMSDYLLDFITGRVDWAVEEGSPSYRKVGPLVLSADGATVVVADRSLEGALVIPDGVTAIGPNALRYCSSIESVALPASLTEIGNWAFEGCASLESVSLPDGLERLGYGAFADCASLASANVPGGVGELAERAFSGCGALSDVALGEGLAEVGARAFAGCEALADVALPQGLVRLGDEAFYGCTALTRVAVPASLSEIGEFCFYHCRALVEVEMPGDVSHIEDGAFTDCGEDLILGVPSGTAKAAQWAADNHVQWRVIGEGGA